ncbi:nucleotide binding protein-like protein [Apiospora arundinis]
MKFIPTPLLALMALPMAPGTLARPSSCKAKVVAPKAIYTISNDQQNAVIAMPVQADGMVGKATSTATGGTGANGIDGSKNEPSAPDALFSQSALTVAGKLLFAVNAGSNTVSMFAIDAADPTTLTMVGKPAAVPGEFPTTVAASDKNKMVCVGMTGAKAGVACAPFSAGGGVGPMDALRPFDLGQSTPPVGPTNTVSQVFFSRDQRTLFATVKGDPTKNNTGFLARFAVADAGGCGGATVAQKGAMASPAGTTVLFGAATIPGSQDIFATDASFGAAVLSMQDANAVAVKGKGIVNGQKATCWATVSPATKSAFVTDVGTNRLVEMSVANAKIMGQVDLSANGDPGLIDLIAGGNFIYALSPGNGSTPTSITVVDAMRKTQVQHFQIGSAGKNSMGLAMKV